MEFDVTLADIEAAAKRIAGRVRRTPTYVSSALSERLGVETVVKFEGLQDAGSFKVRGCYNKLISLTEDERPQLKALLERCPELRAASGHVRTFARMLTQLTGQNLTQWISGVRAAELPGMSSFAKGLEQDLDAVTQGLTSRWNSGPVEGRVNHIKMIKRQMFGRAGLPLLRKRVLLTAQHR